MKIAMVGAGYVGLVSGVCFADFGHEVVCIDSDPGKIDRLRAGEMPIYEPGLEALVRTNAAAGRLSFTTDLAGGIAGAEAIFIAVGTPSRRGDGHADLTFVFAAAEEIGRHLATPAVIVTKSTVPVGTGDEVERILAASGAGVRFAVASNPEFLREGAAIADFKRPDRIVIGIDERAGDDAGGGGPASDRTGGGGTGGGGTASEMTGGGGWARQVMSAVYRPLFLNRSPILFTGRRTAELIKYAANAFLATKITFINEIADLCEKAGGDVQDVARGIGLDNRIGAKFLHAGPGYGGSCFPKDTLALLKTAEDHEAPLRIVEATVKTNEVRKRAMGRKVLDALAGDAGESVRGKRVAMLGLTFKPNTDDMRDAPSIAIAQALADAGVAVVAYDPEGMATARALMPGVEMADSAYAAIAGADATVIVTEWDAFRALDLARVKALAKAPVLIDLRNIYSASETRAAGFTYTSVGRA